MKETAFEKARTAVRGLSLESIASNTGAFARSVDGLSLLYFNGTEDITLPECTFSPEVGEIEKVLILHYLTGASGAGSGLPFVAYADLKGGMFYHKTFVRRGPGRIKAAFGNEGSLLLDAARAIGGTAESYPDVSARIKVFPRIDVIVTLALKDEEFAPEAGILFMENITDFLSLEDVAFVGDLVAKKLCAFLK